jgi:hypothetical protein
MTPVPRMTDERPYRWVGTVTLWPKDVRELLQALPSDSHLSNQLQDTAQAAATLAERLNEIEGGKAA